MSYPTPEFKILELLAPIESELIDINVVLDYVKYLPLNVDLFVNIANKVHRILPSVFFNMQYIQSKFQPKLFFLENCIERIVKIVPTVGDRDKNVALLEQCINDITKAGENGIFFKGLPMQYLYLNHTKIYRQMRDIDMLFCDMDSFFKFVAFWPPTNDLVINKKLRLNNLSVILSENGAGKISSRYVNLVDIQIDNRMAPFIKNIDAKYAQYLFLPVAMLFKNKIKLCLQTVEFWAISLEHTAYILVAHIVEHGFLRLLWINDLYLLTTKASLDWDWVLAKFYKDGLLPVFYSLLEYTEKIYKNSHIIDNLSKKCPRYFTKLRRAHTFLFLYNNNPVRPSAINIFFIHTELIKNRVKYRTAFFILVIYLLLKVLCTYIPGELRIMQRKIVRLFVIPLEIKLRLPIRLPLYYKIKDLRDTRIKNKEFDIIINWSRSNGFRLDFSSIELEER